MTSEPEQSSLESSLLDRYVRKSPRQKRSRDRLDLILDTAACLLNRNGAERLTMAQVADESGLMPSSIYDYIVDSSDMTAAVAARGLERLRVRLAEFIIEPANPDEARLLLLGVFRTALDHFDSEPGFSEAYAAIGADPTRVHIDLDDSVANARMITKLVAPFAKEKDQKLLESKAILLTHMAGSVALMTRSMPKVEGRRIIRSYEELLSDLIVD